MTSRKDNCNAPPSPPGEPVRASTTVSATNLPSPPQRLSPPPIDLPDEKERKAYYYGLPSKPPLVARSSSERWIFPLGPFSGPEPKQLKNIGNHPLASLLASIKMTL